MKDLILSEFIKHSAVISTLLADDKTINDISEVAVVLGNALKAGKKILVAGCGGSAADSQHFAAELSGRFLMERRPLACVALTTDTSAITAIGNDYGFEQVFSRQLTAIGNDGDCLLVISTSGTSAIIVEAIDAAWGSGLTSILLTGSKNIDKHAANHIIRVPSIDTPRIQEMHILVLHTLVLLIEKHLGLSD